MKYYDQNIILWQDCRLWPECYDQVCRFFIWARHIKICCYCWNIYLRKSIFYEKYCHLVIIPISTKSCLNLELMLPLLPERSHANLSQNCLWYWSSFRITTFNYLIFWSTLHISMQKCKGIFLLPFWQEITWKFVFVSNMHTCKFFGHWIILLIEINWNLSN